MSVEQKPSGLTVVKFDRLQIGIPAIVNEAVGMHTFILKDHYYSNGAQNFNGNLHGSANLIEQLRYEKNFEYLRGWGCPLLLTWIGFNYLGRKIDLEQIVNTAKSVGVSKENTSVYGSLKKQVLVIGETGINNPDKIKVLQALGCQTEQINLAHTSDLKKWLDAGFIVIVPKVTVFTDGQKGLDTHDELYIGIDKHHVLCVNTDYRNMHNRRDYTGVFNYAVLTHEAALKNAFDFDGPRNSDETKILKDAEWLKGQAVVFKI